MAKVKSYRDGERYPDHPDLQAAYKAYDNAYTYYWNALNTRGRYPTQLECDRLQGLFNAFHKLRKRYGIDGFSS